MEVTVLVVRVKVALVCPAGMRTVVGTDPSGELDDSVITTPPAGAGPFRVAMMVALFPPVRVVEPVVVRLMKFGMQTWKPQLALWVPKVAERVRVVFAVTAVVVMLKFADSCPARTVTVAGTLAIGLDELRLITVPPVGATPVRVTVPVAFAPPVTLLGETVTK